MKEIWDKLMETIRHNLGLSASIVLVIGLLIWFGGCESQVRSPVSGKLVNRDTLVLEYNTEVDKLEAEMNVLQARGELSEKDLDRQDALKQKLGSIGIALLEGGAVNPVGVATSLIALLGVGAVVDNRIKDRIIKTQKSNGKTIG